MFPDTTESFPIYETEVRGRVEVTYFMMNKANMNYRYPKESTLQGRQECLMYIEIRLAS